jgi:hypothetical protein
LSPASGALFAGPSNSPYGVHANPTIRATASAPFREVNMKLERPSKRMTLRELLIHSEKCTRDLIEQFNGDVLPKLNDLRDLNRPVRRRSHYPTLTAVSNSLQQAEQSMEESLTMCDYLVEQLQTIRESARREMMSRL